MLFRSQALAVAPDDLITTYNLTRALLQLDPEEHRGEADRLLPQVIEAQPTGELTNKAKDLRGGIAARDLRADQPEGLQQDAASDCLQSLQLFEGMDQQRFMALLSEVAAVGQGGPHRFGLAGRGREKPGCAWDLQAAD